MLSMGGYVQPIKTPARGSSQLIGKRRDIDEHDKLAISQPST